MILSDKMIKQAIDDGDIHIDPFDPKALGTNSYDVHLSRYLTTYVDLDQRRPAAWGYRSNTEHPLDAKVNNGTYTYEIGSDGHVLYPGILYLASTIEYTRTSKYVPFLDGKSSIGRLGITIHCTAGRGDVGFANHWTMEIHVVQPVRVYFGMPVGQLIYFQTGDVDMPYNKKASAKYNARDPMPQPSRMWKNFEDK